MSEAKTLIDALSERDSQEDDPGESTMIELARLLTDRNRGELAAIRGELEKLATSASLPMLRQLGFAGLISVDGSADPAWTLAIPSVQGLGDILRAMPLIRDPELRASLYPRIEPLLHGLPASLASSRQAGSDSAMPAPSVARR